MFIWTQLVLFEPNILLQSNVMLWAAQRLLGLVMFICEWCQVLIKQFIKPTWAVSLYEARHWFTNLLQFSGISWVDCKQNCLNSKPPNDYLGMHSDCHVSFCSAIYVHCSWKIRHDGRFRNVFRSNTFGQYSPLTAILLVATSLHWVPNTLDCLAEISNTVEIMFAV